jgi:hypothetical protein
VQSAKVKISVPSPIVRFTICILQFAFLVVLSLVEGSDRRANLRLRFYFVL